MRRENKTLLFVRKKVKLTRTYPISQKAKGVLRFLLGFYLIVIALMCFIPQPTISSGKTPGIFYVGRVPLLLTPFNTLLRFSEITDGFSLMWVLGQNLANIFLLYPFFLIFFFLYPSYSSYAKAWRLGLSFSLLIEVGQILLDIFFDFNRVFEVDDLWTNTLGAILAALSYAMLTKYYWYKKDKSR
ncbi:VanZ family protein [Streptococcus sp. sy010]|uniref:VanZ family protein n=1 Tax=Streptococcus sp. sy010 TaxID=2600148 RepID=UPI0011B3CE23|nr:VanZ family protein [Streptococcus sp. sy010]TWT16400.1 VanZ family protein [Streptococcus sp. sy010]